MFPEGRALEFLIVAAVALIFVGPKDLPVLLRKLGQFMAKVRGMAAEFRASFDEMARQSELDELRKEVEAMRKGQMADIAASTHADVTSTVSEINDSLVGLHTSQSPMTYQYTPPEADPPAPAAKPKPRARKTAPAKTPTRSKAAPKAPAKTVSKPAPFPKPRTRKPTGTVS